VGVPTLVIHGEEDPLVTPPGGEATARAVPGATYLTYAGMGHQIPEPLWVEVVDRITALSEEAEARA
jgi:pimeloyl-ACP methyl ester carboxylesterase